MTKKELWKLVRTNGLIATVLTILFNGICALLGMWSSVTILSSAVTFGLLFAAFTFVDILLTLVGASSASYWDD